MDRSERERFANLLEPVHDAAVRYCLRLCASRQDAHDLYHDALLAAWHGLSGLTDPDKFKPWLFRIITNTFKNQIRRRKFFQWFVRESAGDFRGEHGHDPRRALAARRLVEHAMTVLSPEDRALIVLFELEDHSIDDIAAIWDKPAGTIKSRLARARAKMRRHLQKVAQRPQPLTHQKSEVQFALPSTETASE